VGRGGGGARLEKSLEAVQEVELRLYRLTSRVEEEEGDQGGEGEHGQCHGSSTFFLKKTSGATT